jgi:hypothetical protein
MNPSTHSLETVNRQIELEALDSLENMEEFKAEYRGIPVNDCWNGYGDCYPSFA